MPLKTAFQKHTLEFKFRAGTSRGHLTEKETFIIKLWEQDKAVFGLGECGPLKKLSLDDREDLQDEIEKILKKLDGRSLPKSKNDIYDLARELAGPRWPSIRFGLETAMLDLLNGGNREIFKNDFSTAKCKIPINGLIWMGHMEDMLLQITDKVDQGFDCIKMKVGSLDFDKERDILEYIRRKYFQRDITIRVDANGAFKPDDALFKLEAISKFNIHSIEQPIAAGQPDLMNELVRKSPIEVALDEELIGLFPLDEKEALLEKIKPHHIILKPTLVGGFQSCDEWIALANKYKIGWWLTSALESNIGLNAICQYAAELNVDGYQGLGTGQLYHNNFPSPLEIKEGMIFNNANSWDLSMLSI